MRAVQQDLGIDLHNNSREHMNRLSTRCIVRRVFRFDWNATLCKGSVGAVGSQYVKIIPGAPQIFGVSFFNSRVA